MATRPPDGPADEGTPPGADQVPPDTLPADAVNPSLGVPSTAFAADDASAEVAADPGHAPEADRPLAAAVPTQEVRPAGPDAMAHPPAHWDETDQTSDESFPASDPPGTNPGVD